MWTVCNNPEDRVILQLAYKELLKLIYWMKGVTSFVIIFLVSGPKCLYMIIPFELTIKVYLNNFKIEEVPMKCVDRLFGGSSTFKPLPWIKEYLRWFFWGIKRVRRSNKKK